MWKFMWKCPACETDNDNDLSSTCIVCYNTRKDTESRHTKPALVVERELSPSVSDLSKQKKEPDKRSPFALRFLVFSSLIIVLIIIFVSIHENEQDQSVNYSQTKQNEQGVSSLLHSSYSDANNSLEGETLWQTTESAQSEPLVLLTPIATQKPTPIPTQKPTMVPVSQIGDVDVYSITPTSAIFDWTELSSGSFRYSVNLLQAERAWYGQTSTTDQTYAELTGLAPSTLYGVSVRSNNSNVEYGIEFMTPDAPAFREHGYRWKRCRFASSPNQASDFWDSFKSYSTLSHDQLQKLRRDNSFSVVIEFTWQKTKFEKETDFFAVLRTPDGEVYKTRPFSGTTNGKWFEVRWHVVVDELLDDYEYYHPRWEKGEYTVEIYINNMFGGRGKFKIQ